MDDPVHFWLDFWDVLTLRSGYNSTLVILGTTSLGIASGIVGTFAVLRKRALMADALGHATLPGVVGGCVCICASVWSKESEILCLFI